jgi:hypothetical protein
MFLTLLPLASAAPARAAEAIRVGFLAPMSGMFAQAGKDMVYPAVSQFWTYKPEEFPRAPAYDRNYPPVTP